MLRKREKKEASTKGVSIRAGLMVVFVAAVTLTATTFIQSHYLQKGIKQEASLRAQSELEGARSDIMDIVNQAEAAVRNSLWIAQWCLSQTDSLFRVPQRVVLDNPVVVGSTMALVPDYNSKYPLYAPYAVRNLVNGKVQILSLATEEYDYPSQEWFLVALEDTEGYWSEPYFDIGGGDQYMTTYSMPVKDRNGNVAAVLTADVSLDWLTSVVTDIKLYPNATSTIVSRDGNTLVMAGDTPLEGEKYQTYSIPVERTGWTLSISVPEKDLFANVRQAGYLVRLLQLLGLVMLVFILRVVTKNLIRLHTLSEQKERMQSELRIGHDIQMSMVPKTFPPFPDRKDLDFAAVIIPAKEVGGDLYDYYIRDGLLFFCIGDVSGKGVPAAMVMTVTHTLFRAVSSHETSPARIVSVMNTSLTQSNESEMFVTFFIGVLNLASGHLQYCNAGHNPPLLLADSIQNLPVKPNLPLGVEDEFSFQEQEVCLRYDDALFLYTDGLTEAENASAQLFGEERAQEVLHKRRNSMEHLKAMEEAVDQFVGEAPQSDDLTMLFIHYLGGEQHLVLHNDVQEISKLADFVDSIAEENQLDPSLAMSLNLALEEAVTNVVLYAYPKGTDGEVDITARLADGSLEFVISDSGIPFDPTAAPKADTTLSVQERPIGGLGIYLVREIMDDVHYERVDGKNRLSISKKV